jgi:integrase
MKIRTANIQMPEGKGDHLVFDRELIGFGLRLHRGSGGSIIRNWIIQYRSHGRQRRMIVGSAEKLTAAQAREAAKKLLAKVELGGDPQGDKQERRERDTASLRSVIADFLAHKTGVKPGTLVSLRRYLEGPLYLGSLRSLPVDRITRRDIASRLLAVSTQNGQQTAICLRSSLSALFSWAMTMGLVEHNPVVGAFKPTKPKSRERVLVDAELAAIWKGLGDDDYGKVVKLLVLIGGRRAEVGGMRWSEFNDDMSTWTLPKERSKNGFPNTLPVTPLMRDILDSIPNQGDFLFGRKNGFTGWSIGKAALDERLDIPKWVHHDIRRSVATGMGNIKILPHVVEQILNHKSGSKAGVAGIYNKSPYEREVKAAMALWSDHIESIVEGGERKVISISAHSAVQ